MAQNFLKVIIAASQVVGKAFVRAVQQEVRASQQAAKQMRNTKDSRSQSSPHDVVTGISLQEALQILNVKDVKDVESIQKNYNHLFEVNDKSKGGSLYLQSKVFRAKERIDKEILESMEKERKASNDSETGS